MKITIRELRHIIREVMGRCPKCGGATTNFGFNDAWECDKCQNAGSFDAPQDTQAFGSIEYKIERGLKVITLETLGRIAPAAVNDAEEPIWIMTARPVCVHPYSADPNDPNEQWTETNEPELAEFVNQYWYELSVEIDGDRVVILCKSYDDEYGDYWVASKGHWESYSF